MFYRKILKDFTFFFYALFAASSTFSIAAAQSSLGISLILFILLMIISKRNPFQKELNFFYIPVLMYIFWLIVSAMFTDDPLKSIMIIKEEWLFLAVPVGVYLVGDESYRNKLIFALAGAVGIIAVYGIIQNLTGIHWFKDTPPYEAFLYGFRVKGFFSHRLTFGNYFATVSIFLISYFLFKYQSLGKKEKIFIGLTSSLGLIVTVLSHSYGPILAVSLTLITTVFYLKKKAGYIILSIIIAGSILVFSVVPRTFDRVSGKASDELNIENQASRSYIWSNSLRMVEENPLFGVGQGNFYDTFESYNPGKRVHVHAHNDLLNIAAISGIPGMIFFCLIWIALLRKIGVQLKNGHDRYKPYYAATFFGSIAFFTASLTEAAFADEEVRQILMFVWAFGLGVYLLSLKEKGLELKSA